MNQRVFVTGLGAVSPVGLNLCSTWESLIHGKSGINQISSFDTENLLTTIAAEIPDFDPVSILGLKESARMDRFVQLACVASLEAVAHANLDINPSNSNRISVNIASGIGGIITLSEQIQVLDDRGPTRVSPFLVPMMLPDMASGQVSMLLGAKGPNYGIASACSSGSDALGSAFRRGRQRDEDRRSGTGGGGGDTSGRRPAALRGPKRSECRRPGSLAQDPVWHRGDPTWLSLGRRRFSLGESRSGRA